MKRIKRLTFVAAFFLTFGLHASSQTLLSDSCHQLADFPFVFVSDHRLTSTPVISDSLFDAVSRGIHFQVNSTQLNPNDPFVELYRQQLVPWLRSHDMQIFHVYVKGAASPEGPYNNNVRLSHGRTKKLIEFLHAELGQSKDTVNLIDAQSIAEDYGLLVKMMAEAGDADYQRVNQVWQSCKGDEASCKHRLMALDKGRLWHRLVQQYFPALRQARMALWFVRNAKPIVMEWMNLVPLPANELPASPLVELPVAYERRHLIAVRTNLLHDFLYVPQFGFAPGANIQLEYYPLRGHYTYNAGFTFISHRRWNKHKFFQIRDLQFELRRYFRGGGVFRGPYLSVYAHAMKYGIGFSKVKGWEGEGAGAGISAGYTFKLNRKGSLRMELSASVGMFYTRHDPYVYGNPFTREEDGLYYYEYYGNSSQFKERNHQWTWFGPTNAGIHITYDIIYRKKKPVGYYDQKGGRR